MGRCIYPGSQEGLNNAASESAHGKRIQWSLPSGRRGIIRNLPLEGFFPGTDSESETVRGT